MLSDAQKRPRRAYSFSRPVYGLRKGICASKRNMGLANDYAQTAGQLASRADTTAAVGVAAQLASTFRASSEGVPGSAV